MLSANKYVHENVIYQLVRHTFTGLDVDVVEHCMHTHGVLRTYPRNLPHTSIVRTRISDSRWARSKVGPSPPDSLIARGKRRR